MGINIGAFICNIIAAFMRNKFGWGEAFITAGIGMLVGLVVFTVGLNITDRLRKEACTRRRYQTF